MRSTSSCWKKLITNPKNKKWPRKSCFKNNNAIYKKKNIVLSILWKTLKRSNKNMKKIYKENNHRPSKFHRDKKQSGIK